MRPEHYAPSARIAPGDTLTRFVFEHAAVSGSCVTLGPASRALIACHPYPPAVARAIAEMAACAALLSSALKFDGRLVLQLSGDGPLRLVVVESGRQLALRATAQWSAERIAGLAPDASLEQLAGGPGHGRFVIVLDRDDAPTYQGIVALQPGSVADLIAHYLEVSEQIDSRIALAYADGAVAALLLQRMPSAVDDDRAVWRRIGQDGGDDGNGQAVEALLAGTPVDEVLQRRFPTDDIRRLATATPHFECSCSRERVARALLIAGPDEVEAALAERGDVEVRCEFCNRRHLFTPGEARALFATRPVPARL
jgi:molecular chaperone Hsp33